MLFHCNVAATELLGNCICIIIGASGITARQRKPNIVLTNDRDRNSYIFCNGTEILGN